MAVTRRQVLGDVVTAYEVSPDDPGLSNSDHQLARPDKQTADALFDRMMQESQRLAEEIKLEKTANNGVGG
jgi:hypothetical protein